MGGGIKGIGFFGGGMGERVKIHGGGSVGGIHRRNGYIIEKSLLWSPPYPPPCS